MSSEYLNKLLNELKEDREKKAEKERKKKEKEKEKLLQKKLAHKKLLKKRQNRRYYKKVKAQRLKMRAEKGDKRSYHLILIMKDYKRKKRIGAAWWMTDAYEIYNKAIEENRKTVKFPIRIHEASSGRKKTDPKSKHAVYEIMILQRTPDGQVVNKFRNKAGKYVPNIIIDNENYTIIAKDEWLVEETFNVFGYHPIKDRKTFEFILNEIIKKDDNKYNVKRVFTYNNRVIVQYDDDIDIITCKTSQESHRLYDALKANTNSKYIFYTGNVSKATATSWLLNKLEEKTGWSRNACKRTDSL